jgi:hypothetical protein
LHRCAECSYEKKTSVVDTCYGTKKVTEGISDCAGPSQEGTTT